MKTILLLACLFICSGAYAQNCKGIEKKVDNATGKITYVALASGSMLQISNPKIIPVIVMGKLVSKSDTAYILSLGVSASSVPPAGAKGISMLFSDGSRIDRQEQAIKVQSTANGVSISAEPLFTAQEFSQLTTKTLTGIQIVNNEGVIQPRLANSVNALAACLLGTW